MSRRAGCPMTHLKLKYILAFKDRHGKRRYYFRRSGRKLIALPGLPGSAAFMAAYQAALAGKTVSPIEIGASRSKPGSVAAAVALYLGNGFRQSSTNDPARPAAHPRSLSRGTWRENLR